MRMKRILLFQPSVETLRFFSERCAEELVLLGFEVRCVKITEPFFCFSELKDFILPHETVLITFNFHAIQQEAIFYTEDGKLLFDLLDVACINIVVDHPYYYYEELKHLPNRYLQICIDEDHTEYMKMLYPRITCGETLSIAGTALRESFPFDTEEGPDAHLTNPALLKEHFLKPVPVLPISKRSTDLVFTGCYTNPDTFLPYMKRNGKDYEIFYQGIIDDLMASPDQCSHTVYLRHLNRELPELSIEDLRNVMSKMIFLDLFVRFTFRGTVIRTLNKAGIKVSCIGAGCDSLKVSKPSLLTETGYSSSAECLRAMANAKLSLNVMPWFKQGTHDRVYSSMLNGSVSVTDKSKKLCSLFEKKEFAVFYDLKKIDQLPEQVSSLLSSPDRMQDISNRALRYAKKHLTFQSFIKELLPYFSKV